MNRKNIIGYIYPEIYDNTNKEINKELKEQIYKAIKNIYLTEFNKLLLGIYTKKAFEILCFEFYVTNKKIIKLNNISINFENELVNQKYIYNFIDNIFNLILFKKENIFEKIITKKYNMFNDEMVNSFSFYYCHRIENNLEKINIMKNNIKNYSLQFIYNKPFKALLKINNNKLIDNKFNGKYTLLVRGFYDYKNYNQITNIIIERCNVKCRFGKSKTMLELAEDKNNIKNIMKDLYEKKMDITYKKVSDSIYTQTKTCTFFPINVVYGFIKYFGAKSMLDISTGWGDRLIAACIADIVYYGADPNTCNIPYYTQMIELFGNKNKQKFTTCGFENLEITDTYDLIFTSPPFFDVEIYSESKDDSLVNYNTQELWYKNFLVVVSNKACGALEVGGHFAIYITPNYIYSLKKDLTDTMKYIGIIYNVSELFNIKTPLLYVWRKIK
jgi:hypothetical protein